MGRSADGGKEDAHAHVSAPLSTLKDPASFGPPPKHRAYYGDAAGPPRPRPAREPAQAHQREDGIETPPAGPYAADTTGLSTAHLPKPPAFRPNQATPPAIDPSSRPKPNLPPRLPPRQNSHPDAYAPAPPPPYQEATQDTGAAGGYLNQGALNRLGQAGVSVPGLEIGRHASPPVPPRQTASPPVPPRRTSSPLTATPPAVPSRKNSSQLNELQSRFANLRTSSSQTTPSAPPATGTTWAEKQAALKTVNTLHSDPSKVTLSDARSAASTANNFRERHGEQVAAGWKAASNLNQKYGIAGRVNSLASGSKASPPPPPSPTTGGLGKKAPPPPPPPKKKELGGAGGPPPIPLGSKPKF